MLTSPLLADIVCFADYDRAHRGMILGKMLDTETGSETNLPGMNVERSHYPSAVAIQQRAASRIYMFGGGDHNEEVLDSCEFIDVGEDRWILLEARMNTPRATACAMLLDHTTIVICGGVVNDDARKGMSSCESLDLNTHTFSPLPDMLKPRYGHAGVHYSGTVVVIGGGNRENTCEQFDPAVFRWTPFAPISEGGRGGYVDAVVIEGKIYARIAYDVSVRVYDGAAWTIITQIPKTFMSGAAVALGGKFVVIHSYKEDADVFDPTTNSWSILAAAFQRERNLIAISF